MSRQRGVALWASNSSRLRLSGADALGLLEIIDGAVHCTTEESFRGLFWKLQSLVPFEHACAMLGRRAADGGVVVKHFLNVSCLEAFVREFAAHDYIAASVLSREHFGSYRLSFWAEALPLLRQQRKFRKYVDLARDLGMRDGYSAGMRPTPSGPCGGNGSKFCLSVPAARREERTETLLELVVPHLHVAFCRLFDRPQPAAPAIVLSAREKEILGLMMQGKSSWDMSMIIGISEWTVNYHVYNVIRKLEVVNRPQAVAAALRLGLIDID